MCKCENCNCETEKCEAHSAEYEAQMKDLEEMNKLDVTSGDDVAPTQEEINVALIADVKDNISLFSENEKVELKNLIIESLAPSAKDRVELEAKDLSEKIDKLHSFLNGYTLGGVRKTKEAQLTDAAIFLLKEQEKAMVTYFNCLVSRLSIWGVKGE